jgi:WD40 repeat protein
VIDAVDECVKYSELFTLLKSVQSQFPLRILLTSRKLPDMPRLLRMLDNCEIAVVEIPVNDTMNDINLYVRSRIVDLPVDEDNEREDIARQILAKSGTSFLWVRLVMDELEGVYGYDSIKHVLQAIPEGMFPYYARAVAEMSEKRREQHVAKAILSWVMLATRPLSVSELSHALQLDINVRLPSAKSAVEGLCGQLVSVDVYTALIQPVHATAREFILSQEAGEFQVSKTHGHEKIALTCLRLLTGPDMQPPRHRRMLLLTRNKPSTSVLADYAITQFSEHIVSASHESDQLLLALDKFLRSTVLTWIEKIMVEKKAYRLFRAAKNLKAYLSRRAKYQTPLNCHISNIAAWTTDFTRIVSSFSRALIRSPDAVYFLIPSLCPTQSAIFQQFGKTSDGLTLSGYRQSEWSDCVASIRFEEETAAAVGCDNSLIAVGMESGALHMYNSRSYQKERTIVTTFPVDKIHFDVTESFVAVSGRKLLGVWDINGTMRWKTRIRHRCILLVSSQDTLVGITPQGRSYHWDINTGELVHEQTYTYRDPASDQASVGKAPSAASLSPGFELLSLAYRNSPVCIFDCNSGNLIGWAIDENNRAAEQVIFNPNPDLGLLLVAYNESHLSLYNSWSGQLIESAEAESHVILNSVTCSPDGRTFASVDIRGHLRIWDFESLTLLYHVLTPNNSFSQLHFTSDGLGLLHVVDHELKVWAPSALVRKTMEEEASFSDQSPVLSVTEGQVEKFQASKIRTLIAHPLSPILIAGNHNGDVLIYQSSGDYQPSIFYTHNGNIIRCLASSRHNVIASADIHANLQVRHFDPSKLVSVQVEEPMIETNFSSPVTQLVFDASGMYLLVSTISSDHVYSIEHGACIGSLDSSAYDRTASKWFVVTEQDYCDHFMLLADGTLSAYSVKDFSTPPRRICGTSNVFAQTSIKSVTELPGTLCVIVETQHAQSHIVSTSVLTLPPWIAPASDAMTTLIPSDLCAQFLGASKASKRIMFLHPTSWVCSADLAELAGGQYLEHFFAPEEYNSLNSDLNNAVHPVQTHAGDFAFCMYDKVVVIKGGLKFQVHRLHA